MIKVRHSILNDVMRTRSLRQYLFLACLFLVGAFIIAFLNARVLSKLNPLPYTCTGVYQLPIYYRAGYAGDVDAQALSALNAINAKLINVRAASWLTLATQAVTPIKSLSYDSNLNQITLQIPMAQEAELSCQRLLKSIEHAAVSGEHKRLANLRAGVNQKIQREREFLQANKVLISRLTPMVLSAKQSGDASDYALLKQYHHLLVWQSKAEASLAWSENLKASLKPVALLSVESSAGVTHVSGARLLLIWLVIAIVAFFFFVAFLDKRRQEKGQG